MPDDPNSIQPIRGIDDYTDREITQITRLIPRIRHGSLRSTLQTFLRGDALAPEAISALLRTLQDQEDGKWKERLAAAWAIGRLHLPSGLKEQAAEVLQTILATPRELDQGRTGRIVGWVCLAVVLLMVGEVISIFLVLLSPGTLLGIDPFLVWGLSIIFTLTMILGFIPVSLVVTPTYYALNDTRYNRIRAAAATSLGWLGLRQSLPTLVAAACGREKRTVNARPVREAALDALPALLPMLTTEDYGRLGSEIVPDLCRLLKQFDPDLVLCVLEALGKIGDGRAVGPVERLAEDEADLGLPRLQEVAERVLPILRQRHQEENAPRVLLRATYAPSPSAETLLRPAQGVTETAPQVLLRPSAQEEGA